MHVVPSPITFIMSSNNNNSLLALDISDCSEDEEDMMSELNDDVNTIGETISPLWNGVASAGVGAFRCDDVWPRRTTTFRPELAYFVDGQPYISGTLGDNRPAFLEKSLQDAIPPPQ